MTFDRSVNIKEICWNLNNIRLKDCDLGAIVNRELTQRVRPVMVLANHKPVMRQDVKFAAKIVQKLDQKHRLWANESTNEVSPYKPVLLFQMSDFSSCALHCACLNCDYGARSSDNHIL